MQLEKFEMLEQAVSEADMVLVGLGEEWVLTEEAIRKDLEHKNKLLYEMYSVAIKDEAYRETVPLLTAYYYKNFIPETLQEAYKNMLQMLEGKNYFVVTLCTDDKIYRSNIKPDRIVAPCGSYSFLQCEDVCTEDIYSIEDYREELEKGIIPICSKCGKSLIMNHIGAKKYSEEGYLKKWSTYMKWFQGSLNKNIRILELGVGMKYPSVIRWPFERVTLINNKAKFMRVHERLFQLTEDIKDKGISIEENPIDFLRNQIV